MEFRITGIDPEPFARYFEMTDDELAACYAGLQDGKINSAPRPRIL